MVGTKMAHKIFNKVSSMDRFLFLAKLEILKKVSQLIIGKPLTWPDVPEILDLVGIPLLRHLSHQATNLVLPKQAKI